MISPYSSEELCRISKGLYSIVNWKIGLESRVRTRRQLFYVCDMFDSCVLEKSWEYVLSGSRGEGFELKGSDVDFMLIQQNVLVIDNGLRNVSNNVFTFPIGLVMETDNVPPGYTLLKCKKHDSRAHDHNIDTILFIRADGVYVSSQKAQQITIFNGNSSVHGPCRSGVAYGKEYDCAFTLKCPFWPKNAYSFIRRSIRNGWPTTGNLIGILKEGCLLVPISSKQRSLSDSVDLEWRISFSLAEKKLVYSMNHCQFLCYGLMKIFLNEVLKEIPETQTENGNALCSYFIKTAVFWEISECGNDWSDRNFLNKFLNVFSRVIKWVEDGYCPNFFIPENNMFYGKIYGRRQRDLMLRLRSLYHEGILCLYRCPSLADKLLILLDHKSHFDLLHKHLMNMLALLKESETTMSVLSITQSISYEISDLGKLLWYTASLQPGSAVMLSAITLRISFILQRMAVELITYDAQNYSSNKLQYVLSKKARSILRKSQTSYCLDTIHQAVVSYMNGEYHKTIQIVDHIHQRLQTQPYMYAWDIDRDKVMESRQQGMSYEEIIKRFVIEHYQYNPLMSIPELTLESIVYKQNSPVEFLIIPPLVFLQFLVILSYTRLDKPVERKEALEVLHSILYHDNHDHIYKKCKAISWEILGVCQQLCGDYVGAHQSYINALNDKYNDFKEATFIRLHNHHYSWSLKGQHSTRCTLFYSVLTQFYSKMRYTYHWIRQKLLNILVWLRF